MSDKKDHIQDIKEIKAMMEKSSKFLSLSGLSGVSAGLIALVGAAIAYYLIDFGNLKYDEHYLLLPPNQSHSILISIFILGISILIAAVGSGFYFSWRKARRQNASIFNRTTYHMIISMLIPLATGGLLCLIMFFRHDVSWLASITLIFYGLGLVSASKYTMSEVQYLGISEIILGLLSAVFLDFGLIFWAIGFGLLHIVYGLLAYIRYEK